VFLITTVLSAPHVMLKKNHADFADEGDKLEGFCVDMLAKIASIVGFRYKLRLVKDGKYGGVKEDGSWNGMIGELLNGEAHMAVAPLSITRVRERVVDFSKPFMVTGITIMVKKPDKQEFSVFAFMQPLSTEIWTYIIIAYLGVRLLYLHIFGTSTKSDFVCHLCRLALFALRVEGGGKSGGRRQHHQRLHRLQLPLVHARRAHAPGHRHSTQVGWRVL